MVVIHHAPGWDEWRREATRKFAHLKNAALKAAAQNDSTSGLGARVAIELSAESARTLVETILAVLARAEAGGFLERAGG